MKRSLLFLILMSVSAATFGWEAHISASYRLGDGDSRLSARKHAQEALRVKASRMAQSYVHSSTRLEGDELHDSVEVITAALVGLKNYQENFVLGGSDNGILEVSANVQVDESVLGERIQALREDRHKQKLIASLARQNRQLREFLATRHSSGSAADMESLAEAMAIQSRRFSELEKNLHTVDQVFSRGTLLTMATQEEKRTQQAKAELQESFFSVLQNLDIQASVLAVKKTSDGYEALVSVNWRLPLTDLSTLLKQYVDVSAGRNTLTISNANRPRLVSPRTDSRELFNWLAGYEAVVSVSIEDSEVEVPLFFAGEDFFTHNACGVNPDHTGARAIKQSKRFNLCVVESAEPRFKGGKYLSNPLTIPLTKEQAIRATSVETAVVLRKQ